MPRFVLLEHDHPHLHWDFMLESDQGLLTWRLPSPPIMGVALEAEQLPHHRFAYLDYEGAVSGNRGRVVRWDGGTFLWEHRSEERLVVRLQGVQLKGRFLMEYLGDSLWKACLLLEEGGDIASSAT